jgi:hypothetical protein
MKRLFGLIVVAVMLMAAADSAIAAFSKQTSGGCANGNTWVSTTWFDNNGTPNRVAGVDCDGNPYDKNLSIRGGGGILPSPTWGGSCASCCSLPGFWQATVNLDANKNPISSSTVVGVNCLAAQYEAYF